MSNTKITRKNKPYTARESKIIWNEYHKGMHPETIAIKLDRTEKGIYNQITTLKKTLKPRSRLNPDIVVKEWDEVAKLVAKEKKTVIKTVKSDKLIVGLTHYCALATGLILGILVGVYLV